MATNKHSLFDAHVVRSMRSIGHALYVTAGFFLMFFVLFHIASSFYISYISKQGEDQVRNGIKSDQNYLRIQGNEVAHEQSLADSLANGDRSAVLNIIQTELGRRLVGRLTVADERGVVVGRTINDKKYGDNVFLINPVGREVSKGRSVDSIEHSFSTKEIYMMSGQPVIAGTKTIGAIFASNNFDDGYAKRFKAQYLKNRDAEIAFYTKGSGIYGSSIVDSDKRVLMNSYFDVGSDWISKGVSGQTVYFDTRKAYIVINIVFHGQVDDAGGALLFIPRDDISETGHFVLGGACLILFLILTTLYHRRTRGEERGWRYGLVLLLCASLVYCAAYIALWLQDSGRLFLTRVPYPLYNSTIKLDPEVGIYDVGTEQTVSIVVDTGDEEINVVEAHLHFDPTALHVSAIDSGTSTCEYVVERKIDNKAGVATIVCGIVEREPTRRSIPIANITFQSRRTGSATITFDDMETRVLANDGLGTNVLRTSSGGSYRFDNFKFSELGTTTASTSQRASIVFSPTHANESRWYNSPKAHFVWLADNRYTYRYSFDTNANKIPDNDHVTQENQVDVSVPGDGVYYFHLQRSTGGPVAHYMIRSDMTPPTITAIKLSSSKISAGDVVRFSFDAVDPMSGIQNNYYADLGNHLFLPIGQQLFVPFIEPGDTTVTLRVYDNAGNYAEKSQSVHVEEVQ